MSEKNSYATRKIAIAVSLTLCGFVASNSYAGIDGSDALGIDGSDALGIDGSDALGIDGSDALGIDGSDALGIDGSDALGIDGSDALGIDGSDALGIDGSDALDIDGIGELLIVGSVGFLDNDFASILGQSVFSDAFSGGSFKIGDTVAVYGSIDAGTGSIVNSFVVKVGSNNSISFLTGFVDQVNTTLGIAVVSGVTVHYSALLSNGIAPRVGQMLSVSGRVYTGFGMVVVP